MVEDFMPEFVKSLDELEDADCRVFYAPCEQASGYRLLPFLREQCAQHRKELADYQAEHAACLAELEKETADQHARFERVKKEIAAYQIGTTLAAELSKAGVAHPGMLKGAVAVLAEQPFEVERLDSGERIVRHRDGWTPQQVVARWLADEGAEFVTTKPRPTATASPTPVAVYVSANRTVH